MNQSNNSPSKKSSNLTMSMVILTVIIFVILFYIINKYLSTLSEHFTSATAPTFTVYEGRRDRKPDTYEIKGGGLYSRAECEKRCADDPACTEYMHYGTHTLDTNYSQNCWLKGPPSDREQTLDKIYQDDEWMTLVKKD